MIGGILKKWCAENDMEISDKQVSEFEVYAEMLVERNKKINLTAITEPKDIAVKHFIDSISLLKHADIKAGASLIDIGTGAGFPGIPLKIMRKDINLTMLDSLNKRLLFLDDVCTALDISSELVHARAEELGQKEEYREKYDVCVSRAVASLPELCEYCIPYVKVGGMFLAMKGSDGESELNNSYNAINVLGGKTGDILSLSLPDESRRTIIVVDKVKPTPTKYPRRSVKINKNPL